MKGDLHATYSEAKGSGCDFAPILAAQQLFGARVWHTAGQMRRGRVSSITTTIATGVAATTAIAVVACHSAGWCGGIDPSSICPSVSAWATLHCCQQWFLLGAVLKPVVTRLSPVPSWVVLERSTSASERCGQDEPLVSLGSFWACSWLFASGCLLHVICYIFIFFN